MREGGHTMSELGNFEAIGIGLASPEKILG